jgi:hypothetical protein
MRSRGYDPTGERAVECAATAVIVCEFCGPMCAHCAKHTVCFQDEHKPIPADELQSSTFDGAELVEPKPLHAVVYLELTCPNCGSIRLALPKQLEPQTHGPMGCPICAAESPAKYLAHGLTQRDLPFYEPFDPEPATLYGVQRIPWDRLPPRSADADRIATNSAFPENKKNLRKK